jgi:hypothetical protein
MTIKKAKIISKNFPKDGLSNKPNTVMRAGITAEIKPTRGKQLVEHNPLSLIPDPSNPRPGDKIDDAWINNYLMIGEEHSLCSIDESTGAYFIPPFEDLASDVSDDLRDEYEFLRDLAFSIRTEGLIEPIEIFLADKDNDQEYFVGSNLDYGYVVLEGHKRRLAGIISGVKTVTCIEITDETMLARLKVKHRKLRRQLSENNLRRNLSVSQNFKIVKELLKSDGSDSISTAELSSIIGLNIEIASALKRLILSEDKYPKQMFHVIENRNVSFKWIRMWVGKSFSDIEDELRRLISGGITIPHEEKVVVTPKARGKSGGAVKKSASFKVKEEGDSIALVGFLFDRIPELKEDFTEALPFHGLEKVLTKLMGLARQYDPGRK